MSTPRVFRAARFKLGAVAFALGALTVLGFAPFYFYFLPPLTVAAVFYLWLHTGSRRSAFIIGYLFGLGLYGVGASWVYVSLHDFGMMPMPLAVLSTALFCAFLALFPACVGWLQAWIKGAPALRLLLVMPAIFALFEWSLSWVFTGFPWLTLGYTQAPAGPLAGFAPLLGVFGVSWLLALSAGLIALAYPAWRTARKQAWTVLGGLLILWSTGAALNFIAWTHPIGAPVNVSLLQGNIPQEMKWREERLIATLVTYRNLVQASSSELTILPETAIPMFYDQVPENYFAELAQHARNNGGDVILGLPERDADQHAYYNSVISLGASPTQFYRKQHLVPFGEFIPLKPVFGWIVDKMNMPLSDFSRGTATQLPLKVAGQHVAMDICYEDVFGEEIIHQLPQATLLANVSNDAWFGDSIAPRQHLQISQMRALETGRYMLRATNTGMTAILNEKGHIVAQAPMFRETVLRGTAQGMTGSTPFVRWGNGAFLVLVVLALAAGLILFSRARKN